MLFTARVPGREGGPREKNEKAVHVFEDYPPSVSPLPVSLPRARLPLCSCRGWAGGPSVEEEIEATAVVAPSCHARSSDGRGLQLNATEHVD